MLEEAAVLNPAALQPMPSDGATLGKLMLTAVVAPRRQMGRYPQAS
jgi:hypothetical protein